MKLRMVIALVALQVWMPCHRAIGATTGGTLPTHRTLDGEPTVGVGRDQGRVQIWFTGTLLSAETVAGPWTLLPDVSSPFTPDLAGTGKFYKSREPLTNSIFSSGSVVNLALAGPLQAHFDLAFAGLPDGIFPPVREKPYFDAVLMMPDLALPISLRVRGNSSLQECPFSKLKFKVSKEYRTGTPFADAREVKIGTHCAEGGRGVIGRLRDQTAAYREVLAYEILRLMDFVGPRVRRAHIDYQDTTPQTNSSTAVGWQLTRDAFLVEDIEVVAGRLGARVLADPELAVLDARAFDPQLVTDLRLFNALLGNWDYSLPEDSPGVWNFDVLELTNKVEKPLVAVAGDFDLASWVTGVVRRMAPSGYHPELADLERETLYRIEQIHQRVAPTNFATGRTRFTQKRSAIEIQTASASIDEAGRTNALHHVSAFFEALESVP